MRKSLGRFEPQRETRLNSPRIAETTAFASSGARRRHSPEKKKSLSIFDEMVLMLCFV